MPRGTTLRNIRIDDARWDTLGEIAAAECKDRSALVRDMIDVLIDGYDWDAITPPTDPQR